MKIKLMLCTNVDSNDEQSFCIDTPVVPRKGEIVWVNPDDAPRPETETEENRHFGNSYVVDYVDYIFVNGRLSDITVCAHLQTGEDE